MVDNIHRKLIQNKSPFAIMALVALFTAISNAAMGVGDLIWLIGDMLRNTHQHHYFVLFFLLPANLINAVMFFYLYVGINKYLSKCERKALKDTFVSVCKFKVCKEEVIPEEQIDQFHTVINTKEQRITIN